MISARAIGQFLTDMVSLAGPMHTYEYCQIAGLAKYNDKTVMNCEDGGYLTAIHLDGLNKVIGQAEVEESKKLFSRIIRMLVATSGGAHEIDIEFYVNPHDTEGYLAKFTESQQATAERIGLDMEDDFRSENRVLANHMNYEHSVIYLKTLPSALVETQDYQKTVAQATKDLKKANIRIKEVQKAWVHNEDLYNIHKAKLSTLVDILRAGKWRSEVLEVDELASFMATSMQKKYIAPFRPKLWGDRPSLKVSLEDTPNEPSLYNAGFTHLGMQLLQHDFEETSSYGIVKVDDVYVAPVIVETVPERGVTMLDLLQSIPLGMPFTYRMHVASKHTMSQVFAQSLVPFISFSKKYLLHNTQIREGFEEVLRDALNGKPGVNVAIVCSTWAYSEGEAKQLRESLIAKIRAWGQATTMIERGDAIEAALSTTAGFSTMVRAPYTLMSPQNAAELGLILRPAAPFPDGDTMFYHPSGKPIPMSPISKELDAYIELDIAPSGAGKSVLQGTINLNMNFRPGRTHLARHVTLDIGPSAKGAVRALQDALPDSMKHQVIYEKIVLKAERAMNPLDLQLGLNYPTPLDMENIADLICILATPQNSEIAPFMAEMVYSIIDTSYKMCSDPDTSKLYSPGVNLIVDGVLEDYPEASDATTWGARKTWYKVRDFLFDRGHVREAKIAQRYAVPMVPDLPRFARMDETIKRKFGESGKNLLSDFETLISTAVRRYPILSVPTAVDYDDSRYIVLDLNDVTQKEGSSQTAFMYGLTAHISLRNYWLNDEVLDCFADRYKKYAENLIAEIREEDLGVTFEEFRRTQGQKNIRSMINRFMAEGRKWSVMVRVVAQLPKHLDEEMVEHASIVNLLGSWDAASLKDLKQLMKLSPSEEAELIGGGTHGPKKGGPAFLMRYRLKEGWGSQIVRLAKSTSGLWAASTTKEDTIIRETMENLVGNTKVARQILAYRFQSGSAKDDVLREKKRLSSTALTEDIYEKMCVDAVKAWKVLN